jgi:3-oxoacyl-[acyl-carrier protein] reductase
MNFDLEGRTAIVLGSTKGLGLAVAQSLDAEGANVVITGRRAEVSLARAAELRSALGISLDLSVPGAAAEAVGAAEQRFGHVDIVVLNAGGPRPGPAAALQSADLAVAINTLLLAQIELVSLVLAGMRERRWGRIVAIGSSGVVAPLPNLVQSNTVRAALAGYLKTLAAEVAAEGVTVNMVLPGRIDTDRVNELDQIASRARNLDIGEVRRQSESAIPAGRYGTPAEFGAVAAFMCSATAAYVTGTAIRVDGGLIRTL